MKCARGTCKNEFEPKTKSQKYCRRECTPSYIEAQLRKAARAMAKPRNCATCGKEFTPRTPNNIYCGVECRPVHEYFSFNFKDMPVGFTHPDVEYVLKHHHHEVVN